MVPVEFHILSLSVVIYFLLSSKEVYHKQLMYIAQIKLNYIFLQSSVNDYNILGDWIEGIKPNKERKVKKESGT